MPIERSRRCASTVNPPAPTIAMSSMPSTIAASEIVSGLNTAFAATVCGVATVGPMSAGGTPGASNSTATCVGAVTWPGATRAKSCR